MVTYVDQVLHGDTGKGRVITLYEPEHFGDRFLLVAAPLARGLVLRGARSSLATASPGVL